MKHPEREEWIPFLCGEARPADHDRLAAHLDQCDDCRQEIGAWQRSLQRLDDWKLPRPPRPIALVPYLQLAAAAVLVLAVGFGVGRLSARPPTVEQLRAAVEPELRRQVRHEVAQQMHGEIDRAADTVLAASNQRLEALFAAYTENLDKARARDALALTTTLRQWQSQYAADLLALKRDVDTVAVNADAGLWQAERQLVHLAGYTQPAE